MPRAPKHSDERMPLSSGEAIGKRFVATFSDAPIAMAVSRESDGHFLDVNQRFCELHGYARDDIIGWTSIQLGFYSDAESRRSAIEAYWRDGILRDHEINIRRHDGSMLTLEANLDRVEVNGEACILSMLVDVTQRRRAERELAERAEALRRANRALTTVNDALENFAHVVAHDLKEPVRSMRYILTEASERAVASGVRDAIDAAIKSNDRLARLLAGLLEVALTARLDAADLRPLHVRDILDSDVFKARLGRLCEEHSATIELREPPDGPTLQATEAHLVQILGNLVANAITHNPGTPHVLITLRPGRTRMATLTIEDNGPGYDGAASRTLDRTDRGEAPLRQGFGLLIVKRAVERLGGTLTLGRSETLGGAKATVKLPALSGGLPIAGVPWASGACLACGEALDADARQRGDLECGTCLLRNLAERAPALWLQQDEMNLE